MLLFFLFACDPEPTETGDSAVPDDTAADTVTCSWQNTVTLPDGDVAWEGCGAATLSADFAFADDAPPDTRTLDLLLAYSLETTEICAVELRSLSLCGLGTYTVEAGRVATTFAVGGCPGVPATADSTYVAAQGEVTIEALSTGTDVGNLSGLQIPMYVQGTYSVFAPGDVHFAGTFGITSGVSAGDFGGESCQAPS